MNASSPVSIAFDQQIFRRQPRGGISRYFTDLASCLGSDPEFSVTNQSRAQVVHATFYGGRPYRTRGGQRLVSSLFDFTPERHPENFAFSKLRSPHANKRGWLEASDLILSISQATADDLSFFQPQIDVAVRVIHLATQIDAVVPKAVPSLLNRRFWLMVGKRYAYKNGLTLFRALQRINHTQDQPVLVCAGGGSWSREESHWIHTAQLTNKVLQMPTDDAELAWLYRNAEAVVVPSMAEGFSLPLIEALVCDAPVMASDLEAHREVAGSYATLLPALNAAAWADGLEAASRQKAAKPSAALGTTIYRNLCSYYGIKRMVAEHKSAYQAII